MPDNVKNVIKLSFRYKGDGEFTPYLESDFKDKSPIEASIDILQAILEEKIDQEDIKITALKNTVTTDIHQETWYERTWRVVYTIPTKQLEKLTSDTDTDEYILTAG